MAAIHTKPSRVDTDYFSLIPEQEHESSRLFLQKRSCLTNEWLKKYGE